MNHIQLNYDLRESNTTFKCHKEEIYNIICKYVNFKITLIKKKVLGKFSIFGCEQ